MYSIAKHKKDHLRERTKASLEAEKARSKLEGRPKSITPEKEKIARDALNDPNHNVKETAKDLSVSM